MTEASHAVEDLVGRLRPHERRGEPVGELDVVANGRLQIHNGRLSHDGIKAAWSSPSEGEKCDACDTTLNKNQLLMEGATLDLGRRRLLPRRRGVTRERVLDAGHVAMLLGKNFSEPYVPPLTFSIWEAGKLCLACV
jgi:hypothetical protein